MCKRFAPDHCGPTTTDIFAIKRVTPSVPEILRSTNALPLISVSATKACNSSQECLKNGTCFISPNSVATLRSSYGRCYSPVFNRSGIRRVWPFSFKFPHNMAVVKCPCAFRLRRLAQNAGPGDASGIFPVNFHTKCSCEIAHGTLSSFWACQLVT